MAWRNYIRSIAVLSCLAGALLLPGTARAGTLDLTIAGVRNDDGKLMVAIYGSAEGFLDSQRRLAQAMQTARRGDVSLQISGLKRGLYAVAVFHDEDRNGELNRNFIGLPTEGYGFSNDARGFAGPPSFAAAVFSVDGEHTAIRLTLQY